ncbi:MAG TPA: hypothetical protein VGI60_08195 [Chthoniobacterales bacterium]|jgi:hypothetical protein
MKKLPLLILLGLGACAAPSNTGLTKFQQDLNQFLVSPAGQAVVNGAEAAANSAIQQYVATGKVGGKQTAQAAVAGATAQLRTTQTTGTAAQPTAVEQAVKQGSGVAAISKVLAPKVAKVVANAAQQNKGVSPDVVNEAVARGLDQAVAKQ